MLNFNAFPLGIKGKKALNSIKSTFRSGLIDEKEKKSLIEIYVNDAMLFRKIRQSKYKEFLENELEIETSEGLANYTGLILSTYPNKYQKAIREINMREKGKHSKKHG